MIQEYNKSPISLREGKVFIDGIEVMDSVTCTINFTPEVWTGKQIGEQTNSSRWLRYRGQHYPQTLDALAERDYQEVYRLSPHA